MIRLIILFIILIPQSALSFEFEQLFMPGKLIEGHSKIEADCQQCHIRGRDTTQKKLCIDCHEAVANDLSLSQGFHGINKQASTLDCRVCHSDHKGRKTKVIELDQDQFNHGHTNYKLTGEHRNTDCQSCHKTDKKFRETPKLCVSCHKKDDIHKGDLGKKCQQCHSTKGWNKESFDHNKTDFKLKGNHENVTCSLCHINDRYKKTPKTCVACHAIKDVHMQRFGNKCSTCHSNKKWSDKKFNHDKQTLYKIKGAHKNVSCLSCHKKKATLKKKKTKPRLCINCHKSNDVHQGKNGKQCNDCHQVNSWLKTQFDHDKKTKFKLLGKHKKTSCQACHQKDVVGKKTPTSCQSCHIHQDVHDGQQSKECSQCHNEKSWWLDDVRHDHDLTNFPLIGQHATAACETCHLTSRFKDAKKECIDCHESDDVHKQSLGKECQNCHNSNAWLIWAFDHDSTDFNLQGAHTEIHCESCHNTPLKTQKLRKVQKVQKVQCIECHLQDDIHDTNFGTQCQNCHNQTNFQSIDIRSMHTFKR